MSTAVKADNPEVVAGAQRRSGGARAQMLAELMRLKRASGSRRDARQDDDDQPGRQHSRPKAASTDLRHRRPVERRRRMPASGGGDFLVAEADESDASFLFCPGDLGGHQHRRRPHGDLRPRLRQAWKQAFVDFLQRLPFYGVAVLCADDANVRGFRRASKQIVTYGLDDARNRPTCTPRTSRRRRSDEVRLRAGEQGTSAASRSLNLPGMHNVLNALAAIAVATEVG